MPICKSSGPLANVKVRQALNYATNRVAINNALFFGKGQPAWSIFPSTSSYYDSSLTNDYAYNVKKAKQLLAQAGYPHGFSTIAHAPAPGRRTPVGHRAAATMEANRRQLQIVQASNYVTDLYTDNKAQMGLNPQGLARDPEADHAVHPGRVSATSATTTTRR